MREPEGGAGQAARSAASPVRRVCPPNAAFPLPQRAEPATNTHSSTARDQA